MDGDSSARTYAVIMTLLDIALAVEINAYILVAFDIKAPIFPAIWAF